MGFCFCFQNTFIGGDLNLSAIWNTRSGFIDFILDCSYDACQQVENARFAWNAMYSSCSLWKLLDRAKDRQLHMAAKARELQCCTREVSWDGTECRGRLCGLFCSKEMEKPSLGGQMNGQSRAFLGHAQLRTVPGPAGSISDPTGWTCQFCRTECGQAQKRGQEERLKKQRLHEESVQELGFLDLGGKGEWELLK